MARVARSDNEAFERIVRAHQARLLRFAYGLLGDRDTAQDAVQESFVRLWRARVRYRPQAHLTAYLLRLVRNVCIDCIRAGRREPACALDGADRNMSASGAASEDTVALADALRQALGSLPEDQRAVFLLSEQQGLSYKEIADVLGCPLGTVASRKSAATESLRVILRPWLTGDE